MADHAHNKRATFSQSAIVRGRPIGVITRGTTNINRLRRSDRFLRNDAYIQQLLNSTDTPPMAIDVGYGASYTTTCEWAWWLRKVNPAIQVVGLEIDPARVLPPRDGVRFEQGGFELAGYQPQLVRAFNVLRQYDVDQVEDAWALVTGRMAPGGVFIEGTCDEIGRRMTWIDITKEGPQSLTLAWDPQHTDLPSALAERLPKILIHRNIPGNKIYDLLQAADAAWNRAAPFAPYGPRRRWWEARKFLIADGVPLMRQPRLYRDNLLRVPWDAVS
ncbi:MAG: class I SAM-dependent methyltransferase [Corynebacterium sp.]|nr:class I SAM-dependent methyltransferase [Corynebacterium sp.]